MLYKKFFNYQYYDRGSCINLHNRTFPDSPDQGNHENVDVYDYEGPMLPLRPEIAIQENIDFRDVAYILVD